MEALDLISYYIAETVGLSRQALGVLVVGLVLAVIFLRPARKPPPPPPPSADRDTLEIAELEAKVHMKAAELEKLKLDLIDKKKAYEAKKNAPEADA
ncbi:MAG: hypothetical protein H6702_02905 [Myxococcales bacterium]|nr:hypothetical protein [Myxococcales bacterium]